MADQLEIDGADGTRTLKIPHEVAVTRDKVQEWADEFESLSVQINELKKRRHKLATWIEAYAKLGEGAEESGR